MKISLFTEGGGKSGLGHIMRSIALSQGFSHIGFSPELYINWIERLPLSIQHTAFDWMKNKEQSFAIIAKSDVVVVDSYHASSSLCKSIANHSKTVLFIDDNNRIAYSRGLVLNSNIHADEIPYPNRDTVTYLLGPHYLLLRKEFWEKERKPLNYSVSNILITAGGSDPTGITPTLLPLVSTVYPHAKKHVIIGSGCTHTDTIKAAADTNTHLYYSPYGELLASLMHSADLALSAGGQTLYELLALGIPTIALTVASNQVPHVKKLMAHNYLLFAGKGQNKERIQKALISLAPVSRRQALIANSGDVWNRQGTIATATRCTKEYTCKR